MTQEVPEPKVHQVLQEVLVSLDLQDLLGVLVSRDLLVILVLQARQDLQERQDIQEPQGCLEIPGILEAQVLPGTRVQQEVLEDLAALDHLAQLGIQEQLVDRAARA